MLPLHPLSRIGGGVLGRGRQRDLVGGIPSLGDRWGTCHERAVPGAVDGGCPSVAARDGDSGWLEEDGGRINLARFKDGSTQIASG